MNLRLLLLIPAALLLLSPGKRKPRLAPTTERDGVGPVTLRRYWLDVEAARVPPEVLLRALLDHFADLMPWPLAMTFKVKGQRGVGRRGDRYFILMLVRRGFVETELVEPLRFRNRTLRLHPESGWVELRVIPQEASGGGGYRYRVQVQSSVRTSTPADRIAYLLGMAGAQAGVWHTMLHHALRLSGGQLVQEGEDTGEFDTVPGGVKRPNTPGGASR